MTDRDPTPPRAAPADPDPSGPDPSGPGSTGPDSPDPGRGPAPTGREWVAGFARRCGVEVPDDATIESLLDLAGVAAHRSERIAAPIACWILGQTDLTPDEGLALAQEI